MAHDYLEINRLSPSGDVERRINCISGRITVFRSTKDDDTTAYNLALSGRSAPGTFSVLLDGDSFSPSEHTLVGFGEKFAISTKAKVGDYLSEIPVETRERVLLSCGLGGLSDVYCGELSSSQERIVRILKGTLESEKILILNDPFEGIPERFREILAERLTRFAWDKKAIVVVTKLSTRPESWIENEFISRVQLQRPRQATIGFGSGDASINKLIESVRKSVSADVVPMGKPIDLLSTPLPSNHIRTILSSKLFPIGLVAIFLLALLPFGISWLLSADQQGPITSASVVVSSKYSSDKSKEGTSVDINVAALPPKQESNRYLLDGYPDEIKEGIKLAFLGKTFDKKSASSSIDFDTSMIEGESSGQKTMERLLKSLKSASR